jgi:hypothetical protein
MLNQPLHRRQQRRGRSIGDTPSSATGFAPRNYRIPDDLARASHAIDDRLRYGTTAVRTLGECRIASTRTPGAPRFRRERLG